jgi:hypothetical protein
LDLIFPADAVRQRFQARALAQFAIVDKKNELPGGVWQIREDVMTVLGV